MATEINLKPVIIEMWTEYAIGIIVLFLRLFARLQRIKFTKFRTWALDDWFTIPAIILWTFEVSMCQIITQLGSITGLTNEVASKFTPEQVKSYETGSKWLFAAWYVYVTMVWTLKAMMLSLLYRVT
jgi:hypothetical protein